MDKLQAFVTTLSASLEAAEASAAKRKRDFETIVRRAAENERANEAKVAELRSEVSRGEEAAAEAWRAVDIERERAEAAEIRVAAQLKVAAEEATSTGALQVEAVQRRLKESIEENVRLKHGQRAFNRSIETGIRKVLLSYKVAMRWRLKVAASKAAAEVATAAAGAGERAGQRRFLEAEGVFRELAAKQERVRRGLEAEVRALKGDLSAAVLSKAELLQEQEVWEKDTAARVDELETELAAAQEQSSSRDLVEKFQGTVDRLEADLAASREREAAAGEALRRAVQEEKDALIAMHALEVSELRAAVEKGLQDAEEEVRRAGAREEELLMELEDARAEAEAPPRPTQEGGAEDGDRGGDWGETGTPAAVEDRECQTEEECEPAGDLESLKKRLEESEWMQQLLEQQLLAEKAKAQTAGVLNVDLENLRNALILKEEALDILEGDNAALDDQLHAEMDEFEQVRQSLHDEIGGLRASFEAAEAEQQGLEEKLGLLTMSANAEKAALEEELDNLKASLMLKDSALSRAEDEKARLLEERQAKEDASVIGGTEGASGGSSAEGPVTPITHSELQKARAELALKEETLLHLEMERGDLDSLVRNAVMKAESAEREKEEAQAALSSAVEAAEAAERQLDEAMGALAKDESIITEMEAKVQSLAKSVQDKEATIARLSADLRESSGDFGRATGTPEPEHSQALRDLTNTCQKKLQEVDKELQEARQRAVSTPSTSGSSSSYPADSSPTAVLPQPGTRPAGLEALLSQGVSMIKHGRRGRPHERVFWCTPGLDKVCWGLTRTDPYARSVLISQMTDVVEGRTTKGALRAPASAEESLFSLRGIRDLDLQVLPPRKQQGLCRADLVAVFRWVVKASQSSVTPVKASAVGSPTSAFARLRHSVM